MNNAQPFGDDDEGQAGNGGFDPRPINLSSGNDPRLINLSSGSDPRLINLSNGNDPRMINLSSGNDPHLINLNNTSDPRMIQVRANGGPVRKGRPYIVGERGPELVVPAGARGKKQAGGGKRTKADGKSRGGVKGRKAGLDCVPGSTEKKSTWFARLARGAGRGGAAQA